MASAALGTWWITVETGRTPPTSYVVASRQIDPGRRIDLDDLRLAPMTLSPSVSAGAFTQHSAVAGSVALGPIAEGGLIQAGGIAPATTARSGREVSFAVETPWAVDGALVPGDRIDVFATSGADAERETSEVLRGAVVRHLSRTGGGLGETTGLTITVAVPDSADLVGAVSALRAAELTVVRATGVTASESVASGGSGSPVTDRGDPLAPSATTTTTTPRPRSPRTGRSTTTSTTTSTSTTTQATGAGR